jgi:endo-1,3-1,4-beta-glycanase ExoK
VAAWLRSILVSINHFTNGKPYGGTVVQLGFDASQSFHDYGFEWAPDKIRWLVDKELVSETPVGAKIPRNPARLYFSLWSGSAAEDAWMGLSLCRGTKIVAPWELTAELSAS